MQIKLKASNLQSTQCTSADPIVWATATRMCGLLGPCLHQTTLLERGWCFWRCCHLRPDLLLVAGGKPDNLGTGWERKRHQRRSNRAQDEAVMASRSPDPAAARHPVLLCSAGALLPMSIHFGQEMKWVCMMKLTTFNHPSLKLALSAGRGRALQRGVESITAFLHLAILPCGCLSSRSDTPSLRSPLFKQCPYLADDVEAEIDTYRVL